MSNEKSPNKNKNHVPRGLNVLKCSEPFGEVSPRALLTHTHTHTHTTHSVLRGRDAELLLGINSTSTFDKFYENSFCQRHSLGFPQDHIRISRSLGHSDLCRNG